MQNHPYPAHTTTLRSDNDYLHGLVNDYLALNPAEKNDLAHLIRQLQSDENMNCRKNYKGHVTASAIILSPDYTQIFMIRHGWLKKILLPGGHVDNDETPHQAAIREAAEETGYTNLHLLSDSPLDIDTHAIPARPDKDEESHFHHDFKFVFAITHAQNMVLQTQEIDDGFWHSLDQIHQLDLPPSLSRALNKLTHQAYLSKT